MRTKRETFTNGRKICIISLGGIYMVTRITNEEFKARIKKLKNGEYIAVSTYEGANNAVMLKHTVCGTIDRYTPNRFYRGAKCKYCHIKAQTKTTEWFVGKVKKLCGEEYTVLGAYEKAKIKVSMKHELCNSTWNVTPDNFLRRGARCSVCAGNKKLTTNTFISKLESITGDEYILQSSYLNARTKITLLHTECQRDWNVVPHAFLGGARCPSCRETHGERYVRHLLTNKDIEFFPQHSLEGCKSIRNLYFDFYLPQHNMCIEYDGRQHFEPVDFGNKGPKYAQDNFEEIKFRDNIKNTFCDNKGIQLVRIPYYLDLEEIPNFLNNHLPLVKK